MHSYHFLSFFVLAHFLGFSPVENLFVGTSSFYHFSVLQLHIEPSQSPKHALFRAADPVTVSTTFADVEFRNVTLQSPVLSILPDALRCPQMPADALRCSYEQLMNHECSGRNGLLRFWCFDEQNLAANAWNLSSVQLRRQTSWFLLGVWRQPWHGYGPSEQNGCSPWGALYGVLRREKTLRQHRKLLWRAGSTRGNQNLSCTGSLGLC